MKKLPFAIFLTLFIAVSCSGPKLRVPYEDVQQRMLDAVTSKDEELIKAEQLKADPDWDQNWKYLGSHIRKQSGTIINIVGNDSTHSTSDWMIPSTMWIKEMGDLDIVRTERWEKHSPSSDLHIVYKDSVIAVGTLHTDPNVKDKSVFTLYFLKHPYATSDSVFTFFDNLSAKPHNKDIARYEYWIVSDFSKLITASRNMKGFDSWHINFMDINIVSAQASTPSTVFGNPARISMTSERELKAFEHAEIDLAYYLENY